MDWGPLPLGTNGIRRMTAVTALWEEDAAGGSAGIFQ